MQMAAGSLGARTFDQRGLARVRDVSARYRLQPLDEVSGLFAIVGGLDNSSDSCLDRLVSF